MNFPLLSSPLSGKPLSTAALRCQRLLELAPLDDLPPRIVQPVHVEHGEPLVPGGGAAGGGQRQGAALLELLKIQTHESIKSPFANIVISS